MYSCKVKYTDFDGENQEETLYFHYSETELVTLQTSHGSLKNFLERMTNIRAGEEMVAFLKEFIINAHGYKSDDNKRFVKTEQDRIDFENSEAFNQFFMMLLRDENKANDFINKVIPESVRKKINGADVQKLPNHV